MGLRIRLARAGAKKRPFYRIVVADKRSPRDGRFLERLGTYDPLLPKDNPDRVTLKSERVKHWLDHGATPSDRVARFLNQADLYTRKSRNNPNKGKPKAKAQARLDAQREAAAAAQAEAAEASDSGEAESASAEG